MKGANNRANEINRSLETLTGLGRSLRENGTAAVSSPGRSKAKLASSVGRKAIANFAGAFVNSEEHDPQFAVTAPADQRTGGSEQGHEHRAEAAAVAEE